MILVFNLGLKSIRAIVFDTDGKRVATAARRINTRLVGDRVEQDAHEWRELLFVVAKEALDKLVLKSSIKYVTVSCSASCLVPVDEQNTPTSYVIMVSDRRAESAGKRIAADTDFQSLAQRYGYSSSSYSQMARMLWFKESVPDSYAKTDKFLAANDFLLTILGCEAVTDTLNAEKAYWCSDTRRYPEDLYAKFGLSTDKLPRCVEIGANIGPMAADVATEIGLLVRPDIVVGTYDAICSVFGTGVSTPGKVCDVSGTVTSVRMYADEPFNDTKMRVMSQYFPPSNGYLVGGSNNLGGGLIEWAKSCFYRDTNSPYAQMQSESALAKPVSTVQTGIIFIPHLLGARAPYWNSNARGCFFGLERHHNRGDMMRAIFESIGFSIRDFLEIFWESDTHPKMITASGGLANLAIANEIKATITGLPYHYMDEFESTSLGAAIIVLCSTGAFPSYTSACQQMVTTRQIFLPRDQDREYYADMYALYREFVKTIEPLLPVRQEIITRHCNNKVEYVDNL